MSRIFFSYLQVSALARSLPIACTSEVESILDTMATFASPSLSLTSIDCAIADNKTNVGGIGKVLDDNDDSSTGSVCTSDPVEYVLFGWTHGL